ncbi:ferredoxin--NADP reductase [Zavarzinia compransoris]|uniref:3-ketosteroid-9-alpha-hydroxylase n=1 Tax=Zavarzinia compransoris TaxID=1264899 RepID=A0A317DXI2_9PROT|nr:ferredoxin--NADP reductase [Zavarzinia compransoris]PWR19182.1 3-ketosteroid-9-alpha-hydroxylase [Zavarzinia compransoris]TDP49199.1 3-ketosteroid 9alpha-monooxygenase subunit B [Zavarzinia compransoris]
MQPLHYHALKVAEVIEETADAKSVIFEVPEALRERFAYRPGQFLTLRLGEAGGTVARCYSLASSPFTGEAPKVTVKRVAGGRGSNWLCDNLRPGSMVDVLPPAGVFTPKALDRDLLLFAGGSGVTPVMSILKSALLRGKGRIVVVYANRDEKSVIFAAELRALAARHADRLTVLHWLETVQGLPTVAQLSALVRPYAQSHDAFICGPGPFMDGVVAALGAEGVDRNRIHLEKFISLDGDPIAAVAAIEAEAKAAAAAAEAGPRAEVEVVLDGVTRQMAWPASRHLLDVLMEAGINAPHSCRMGSCSACMCKVEAGEVKMTKNSVLDKTDLAEGWVLACQALPVSDRVKVVFPE